MGPHQRPLFVSLDLKGLLVQETEEKSYTDGALWNNNVLQGTRQRRAMTSTTTKRSGVVLKNKKRAADGKRILKKRNRRSLQFGAKRENNGIRRRVRTLKRLIPNSDSKSVEGLDGLFRETADYILCLQSRVRLMQMMVKALAGSDDQ
uniref:transcription factor UPBEAT1 n=1 Tax=Fragaria vesca subsp. vesca TaxID=101020 RepID=UPI0005C9DB32|nr:PREDICTED: transcription factor UPBEAT1 [Fragaria vesca subsp. vesca]